MKNYSKLKFIIKNLEFQTNINKNIFNFINNLLNYKIIDLKIKYFYFIYLSKQKILIIIKKYY